MTFRRFPWCIKDSWNACKWFFQRIFRGYSDPEVWDLYFHNAKWLIPRLRKLKEIGHGFPAMLSTKDKTEEESAREWTSILDKMISAFEFMVSEDWDCSNETQEKASEGLDLYRKYFFCLWD